MHDDTTAGRPVTVHEGALEMLPTAVIIHNHQFVLYANRAALAVLGASEFSQIESRPLSQFVHPDAVEAGEARRKLVMEHGHAVINVPVKLVGVDGVVRYATANGLPVTHDGERAILVMATITRIGTAEPGITPQQ